MSIINTEWLKLYTEIINARVDKCLIVMWFILLRFCAKLLINIVETRQIL
jgi:hypothetical protein